MPNKKNKDAEHIGWVSRSAAIAPQNIDEKNRTISGILTTEEPAIVFDWNRCELIREVLLMEGCELPPDDYLPLLDNHNRYGAVATNIKGSVHNIKVDGSNLRGDLTFSTIAEPELTLAKEGHLRGLSVGYQTYDEYTIVLPPGAKQMFFGNKEIANIFADGLDLFVRTKWTPKEESLTPVGADKNALLGKGVIDEELMKKLQELIAQKAQQTNETENKNSSTITIKKEAEMPGDETQQTPEQILRADLDRRKEIRAIAKQFNGRIADVDSLSEKAQDEGWSIERMNGEIVTRLGKKEQYAPPVSDLDMPKSDLKRYNIWNLVRAEYHGDPSLAGVEIEASNEIEKRMGVAPRGRYIAHDYLKREITIGTGTADKLVATQLMTGNFLDLLYNKMVIGNILNGQMISGVVGNLEFPRKTSSSQGFYIGEGGVATESEINFGSDIMTPKTASGLVKYSRQTALQTTPEMEGIVMNDIINQIKLRSDLAMIQGAGGDIEIMGLLNGNGVRIYDGANFGFDSAVDLETMLEDANVDLDKAIFLTTPLVKGALRKRKIEAGQVAKLWDKDGLISRASFATKQMPANTLSIIDPSEIIVATWGAFEIQINRLQDDGGVKIIPFWSHDLLNRRTIGTVKVPNFS
jgi:HK97 family phage major capsid protein